MERKFLRFFLGLAAAVLLGSLHVQAGPAPLVIHEWGTFTSLQDETGHAIGGINTDDEPVPDFVHRLSDNLVLRSTEVPNNYFKGVPRCDTDVTMRLETPVLYFHPAPDSTVPPVSVTVAFHGGWLSEFYPLAEATAPGVNEQSFGPLSAGTIGTLAWNNLTIGGNGSGPVCTNPVWTSPRAVQAANVLATNGEAEKFLFYRGVAHLDAPLAVSRVDSQLVLHDQRDSAIAVRRPLKLDFLWLVDIDAAGRVAFRTLPPISLAGEGQTLAQTPGQFAPDDYNAANLEKLKVSMNDALVKEGLFDDEAQALLNTWKVSYFKSSGLRLFFMVPQAWTDAYLPLHVSVPAQITRVMVGRIELVTPEQRHDLRQIAETSTNDIISDALQIGTNFVTIVYSGRTNITELNAVLSGNRSFKSYGLTVPKSYQSYLSLGRFRNALILQEARQHPSPALAAFISDYRLQGYIPPPVSPAVAQKD